MIDTDRMTNDVALEYIKERLATNHKIISINRDLQVACKEMIKTKKLIRDIITICIKDEYIGSEMTEEIMDRIKRDREEGA